MDPPIVAGVAGGVGTSTIATALGAADCLVYRPGTVVDVLVARSTMYSLGWAQRLLAACPEPPILAVVADGPGTVLPAPVKARLRMTEPHVAVSSLRRGDRAAVVRVPFVDTWAAMDDPHQDVVDVLVPNGARDSPLPKYLRGFAAALQLLRDELIPRLESRAALEQATYRSADPYPAPRNSVPAVRPGAQ